MKYLVIAVNPKDKTEIYPLNNFNDYFEAYMYMFNNAVSFHLNGEWTLKII